MKQLIAVILFFQILIGGVLPIHDKDETKGIPHLVQHYYVHLHESKGQLSILDFLQLHYKAGSKHQNQEQEHETLPPFHWHEIHYITAFHFKVPEVIPPQSTTLYFPPHFTWVNFYSYIPQQVFLDPPNTYYLAS